MFTLTSLSRRPLAAAVFRRFCPEASGINLGISPGNAVVSAEPNGSQDDPNGLSVCGVSTYFFSSAAICTNWSSAA